VFGSDGPAFVSAAQLAAKEAAALPGGEHAAELVGGVAADRGWMRLGGGREEGGAEGGVENKHGAL